jgi:hypothetical protein
MSVTVAALKEQAKKPKTAPVHRANAGLHKKSSIQRNAQKCSVEHLNS